MKAIKHAIPKSNLILLPFGLFIHEDIVEGEIAEFYDGMAKIISVSEIGISTQLANTLSIGIYGLPISVVMQKMIDNNGDRIWKDRVMVVAIKK